MEHQEHIRITKENEHLYKGQGEDKHYTPQEVLDMLKETAERMGVELPPHRIENGTVILEDE